MRLPAPLSTRMRATRAPAQLAARPWRSWRLVLISMSVLPLLLSACGGSTAPSGYLCTLGRSPTDNGCYRAATWSISDPTQAFYAASTDTLVVPISCTGTCINSATHDPAVSGAGASATGGIYNYLQLSQVGLGYFIRIGYGAIGGTSARYFIDYRLPIARTGGGPPTSQYRRILLGPTRVPPAPSGGYQYTWLQIMGAQTGDAGPVTDWYACLALPATDGINQFGDTTCTLLAQGIEDMPTALGDPLANGFNPDQYSIGEHVYGFSGATAEYAAFTNNQFATQRATGYYDYTGAQELSYQTLGSEVSIQSSRPAPVPFASWITTPAQSPSNGGVFSVECCRAPGA